MEHDPGRPRLTLDLALPSLLIVALVIIISIQIVFRYVLVAPLSWPEEIARWLLVWLTFAGSAYGLKHGSFVSIDYFVNTFLPNHRKALSRLRGWLIVVFYGLFTASGFQYLQQVVLSGQRAPTTRLPAYLPKSAAFVGGLLVLLVALRSLKAEYRER